MVFQVLAELPAAYDNVLDFVMCISRKHLLSFARSRCAHVLKAEDGDADTRQEGSPILTHTVAQIIAKSLILMT